MNWEQIFNQLSNEERLEMARLMLQRIEHPRRVHSLRDLRPMHLLLPAVLGQIFVFIWSLQSHELMFPRLMAGYLVVVALAVLPSAFRHPRPVAHYVRPSF